jgi:hypothetical protein
LTRATRLLLSALALTAALGTATPARATEPYYTYKTVTCYEKVTTYVTRSEPYTKTVTLYDHCDRQYTVTKTYSRSTPRPSAAADGWPRF